MKCRKCEREFEGNFCPNCGTKHGIACASCGTENLGDDCDFCLNCGKKLPKKGKLLGFRSRKVWKMILSSVYLFFVALMLVPVVVMFDVNDPEMSITGILIMMYMVAPYIFLSNFSFRNHLPLFKKHNIGMSIVGMVCIYFIITVIFAVMMGVMPQQCNHQWKPAETVAPTCTEKGHVDLRCIFCGAAKSEPLDKIDHKFVAETIIEGEVTVKCSSCGEVVEVEFIDKSESISEFRPIESRDESVEESDSAVG